MSLSGQYIDVLSNSDMSGHETDAGFEPASVPVSRRVECFLPDGCRQLTVMDFIDSAIVKSSQ